METHSSKCEGFVSIEVAHTLQEKTMHIQSMEEEIQQMQMI